MMKMVHMIQRRICSFVIFQVLIWNIEGLSIYPASDLTAQSFSLVCDLQGTALTFAVSFTYDGTPAGGCSSPPSPTCGSPVGSITSGNQTVNFTLNQNEISRKGNASWVCTHGSTSATLKATVIALCMNGKVTYEDKKIAISCSCGFPSVQVEVEYKDIENKRLPGNQTFDLVGSQNTQCTLDSRAMDFAYSIENFPSGTEEVCATLKTFSQASKPQPVCIGCDYSTSERFFGGFSCFLIVLSISGILLLILGTRIIPKIFGDLRTNKKTIKIIIIAVFILVALIIGLALGFGLKECSQRDLGLGLGLGLGFLLAIALVVTLYIYHRQCDSKKGNEDENRESPTEINSKKPEDNPKRVRSTASASHVKMESKNNTDVLKGDQSPLNKKAMYTELPPTPTTISQPTTAFTHDTPLSRKNKLVPIAMENEEANPSEKKKKKKKKKRKKSEEVGENADRE